ncbi:hypothetical protein HMPREF1549_01064 [Actinomyces johnsonii F0510]|uniref:Uncharacterized protein n=1 Tax=Actinomyces johnsonii F0510 TaxID=1227262 RepID=U1PY30_9ACTO|nr:hypothetical protein HMPREF1549_01064 [Actinomyces johnsonii F0510]
MSTGSTFLAHRRRGHWPSSSCGTPVGVPQDFFVTTHEYAGDFCGALPAVGGRR